MKIYTKTGDKGKTSLFDGTRVYKNNPRVKAYGTVDELNSVIGIVLSESQNYHTKFKDSLIQIQNDLFEIGARLANPNQKEDEEFIKLLKKHTQRFEEYIDAMINDLPELTNFILPGGGRVGAFLQLARTVCRRAERNVVALSQQEKVNSEILVYLNRLSDLFHTMSRYANFKEKKKEVIWTK